MTRRLVGDTRFPRRTLLRAGIAAGLTGLLGQNLVACSTPDAGPIVVAGGETGGFYFEFATLLAEALQRHHLTSNATVLPTGGSVENVSLLMAGEATFAVALADAAMAEGGPDGKYPGQIAALGMVYQNYVHAMVRKDSDITSLADLAGGSAAAGNVGSGTALMSSRLLRLAGLDVATENRPPSASSVTMKPLGLNDGIIALTEGSVDVLFWSGGVPTAAIAQANKTTQLSMLDLSGFLPELRHEYGIVYDNVLVPANSYAGIDATRTIGVPNLLLCRMDLAESIVARTVNLLVEHADELVPHTSAGVQFLTPEMLINTADIPLHPGAVKAYRQLHG